MDMIADLAKTHSTLVTIEEGSIGGFGSLVVTALANAGLLDKGLKIRTLSLPDTYQTHDTQDNQYREAGLAADSITAAALS